MVMTASRMISLGTEAPDFALPDTNGSEVARSDFEGRPLLVMFLCNHCPFVRHLFDGLVAFARDFADRELTIVGINSNDVANYPEDSPEKMKEYAKRLGYEFPYLFDETQEMAKAYPAFLTSLHGFRRTARPRSSSVLVGARKKGDSCALLDLERAASTKTRCGTGSRSSTVTSP